MWAEPRAGWDEVGRVTPPLRMYPGRGDSVTGMRTDPVRNGRSCERARGARAGRRWNGCSDVNEGDDLVQLHSHTKALFQTYLLRQHLYK